MGGFDCLSIINVGNVHFMEIVPGKLKIAYKMKKNLNF